MKKPISGRCAPLTTGSRKKRKTPGVDSEPGYHEEGTCGFFLSKGWGWSSLTDKTVEGRGEMKILQVFIMPSVPAEFRGGGRREERHDSNPGKRKRCWRSRSSAFS